MYCTISQEHTVFLMLVDWEKTRSSIGALCREIIHVRHG
jgi:hypothetical protein